MYKLIISVAFLFVSFHANAQLDTAALKLKYEKEVIYFSGSRYIKGGVNYPFKQLKSEFNFSSEGLQMYKLYQSDIRKQRICSFFALGLFTTGLLVDASSDQNKLGSALVLSSIIPMGFMFHLGTRADKKMKKAVWLRNRDALLR